MNRIAKTLNDIVRLRKSKDIIEISLKNCDDFICRNMMCEMVTETCLCKIDKAIAMLEHPLSIETFDISFNNLTKVPPSISLFKNLKVINLSNNRLEQFPADVLQDVAKDNFKMLEVLDLRNNPINKDQIQAIYLKYPNIRDKILL